MSNRIVEQNGTLGDQIAREVLNAFHNIGSKGKPAIRSNGLKEWTVLASIVAVTSTRTKNEKLNKKDTGSAVFDVEVISLATGVKALPDGNIKRNVAKGYLVHDSHAEILAIRTFNYHLLQEILWLEKDKNYGFCRQQDMESSIVEKVGTVDNLDTANGHRYPYKIKKGVQLALYTSELPCGDSSMGMTQSLAIQDDQAPSQWGSPVRKLKLDNAENGVPAANISEQKDEDDTIRGRAHFTHLGSVRSKPGRADSLMSYSKSCSDKLTVRQYTGLLNSITSHFIDPQDTYLKWLVVPLNRLGHVNLSHIERCFRTRFSFEGPPDIKGYKLRHFSILGTAMQFEFRKRDPSQPTAMNAIVCLPGCENLKREGKEKIAPRYEVINSGVRLGCNSKKERTCVKPTSSPFVSTRKLMGLAGDLLLLVKSISKIEKTENGKKEADTDGETRMSLISYEQVKTSNVARQAAKRYARKHLGNWIPTATDIFECTIGHKR